METEAKNNACRKWQIIIGEYVLGTVEERDRARLERHLGRCEACRRELAEMEEMYRLLGDFELAEPEPFFAAKVERAVRDEAEEAAAAPAREGFVAGLGGWMRRHAVASALTAASVATVAAVLYVKVWLPRTPQETTAPAAGEALLKVGKKYSPPPPPDIAAGERPSVGEGEPRDVALPVPDEHGEAAPAPPGIAATEERPPGGELRFGRAGADVADEVAPRRYEIAEAEEKAMGAPEAKGKEEGVLEEPHPAGVSSEGRGYGGAAFTARTRARDDAAGASARRGEVSTLDRTAAAEPVSPALAGLEEETLTAADVEARMDARFEADIERLTGGGTALVDYVTPNGLLMTYFYELPVEEQKTLLSRLRREAEAATAAELLLSH